MPANGARALSAQGEKRALVGNLTMPETLLRFVQEYAQELSDEIYGTDNFTWGYDLYSLQLLCETGTGTPFVPPSD